jgi:hypothetical protein
MTATSTPPVRSGRTLAQAWQPTEGAEQRAPRLVHSLIARPTYRKTRLPFPRAYAPLSAATPDPQTRFIRREVSRPKP